MNMYVVTRLAQASGAGYHYGGLDAVKEALENIPLVKKYLASN
jgi:hypothetical protein